MLHDWDNYKGFRKDYVENAYKETLSNHTYFDRIENIFNNLNMKEEANNVVKRKQEAIKVLSL